MEQTKKTRKNLIIILILISIVGLSIILNKGLNFDIKYREGQKVVIKIGEAFNNSDIKSITNEVFENQDVLIQKVEIYNDTVSIRTSTISEEQKQNLVNKINEKYGKEIKAEDIEVKNITNLKGRDMIKPYIIPVSITTGIILVYMGIRFFKLNSFKVILKTIIALILLQLTLISVIAIFRIPVNNYTIIAGFGVYILTLLYETNLFEQQLEKKKIDSQTIN